MGMLQRLLQTFFAAYAIGLIGYVVLISLKQPRLDKSRQWLERFYRRPLVALRAVIKPLRLGIRLVDVTPAVLLLGVSFVRAIVFYVLFGSL